MLGKRSRQRGLFEADNQYLDFVGRDSFYGFLAHQRGKLFRDEDFAEFYCPDNGRPSVPPSLLANALLLQTHDQVSDEEAKARADYDLRWKVALGIKVDERPFAKSTLQLFRAQLILKEKMRAVFATSLELAKQSGYLKERRLKVILDTTYILGRGAVKDTYNLLGDGIQQLCRAMAAGGVVFTGPTGETYSSDGEGAIALDTEQPGELVMTIESLRDHPENAQAIRKAAPNVAARYTWENVISILFEKITLAACHQNTEPLFSTSLNLLKPVQDEAINTFIRQPRRMELPGWSLPVIHTPLAIPEGVCLPSGC